MRTICPTCRQIHSASAAEAEELMDVYGREGCRELGLKPENNKMAKGAGCDRCGGTGYRGRMGIHELLLATDRMKSLVARRAQALEIRDLAIAEGMRTLMQDGIAKILQGHTDFHQLRKVVAD